MTDSQNAAPSPTDPTVAADEDVDRIARDLVERYADALERLGR